MPFTFAHPAAVLPLKKFCPRLNLPALIVGSITPDLGYYMHNWMWSVSGHSFHGSLTFDVPAGLILLSVFYLSVRSIARLLPYPHREACSEVCPAIRLPSISALLIASLSILIGAWTHIIWDGFTHANGWCVREFAALTPTVFTIYGYNITVWQCLQQASSILGLALLAWAYKNYVYGRRFLRHKEYLGAPLRMGILLSIAILPAVYAMVTTAKSVLHGNFSMHQLDIFSFNAIVLYVSIQLPLLIAMGVLVSIFEYIALHLAKPLPLPPIAKQASPVATATLQLNKEQAATPVLSPPAVTASVRTASLSASGNHLN